LLLGCLSRSRVVAHALALGLLCGHTFGALWRRRLFALLLLILSLLLLQLAHLLSHCSIAASGFS
jgi:hypothetical protein